MKPEVSRGKVRTVCWPVLHSPPTPASHKPVTKNALQEVQGGVRRGQRGSILALSTSSTALTWSTMASLQTLSRPSWQDGLRFRRSCTVPFCRNLLRSLFKDLLEAGGGALPSPHVWAGHLIDQNETTQFQNKHDL